MMDLYRRYLRSLSGRVRSLLRARWPRPTTSCATRWAILIGVSLAGCESATRDIQGGRLDGSPQTSRDGAADSGGSDSSGSDGGDSDGGSGGSDSASDAGDAGGLTIGTQVSIDSRGNYAVVFASPAWTFAGSLGTVPSNVGNATGNDNLGTYHEVTFSYADPTAKTAGIRAYDRTPVVLFTVKYQAAAANTAPFPQLGTYPNLPHHLTYGTPDQDPFAPLSFKHLIADSPWIYFDDMANAFVLSAANHFMNAMTALSNGAVTTGIDSSIATIPAGTSFQTVLAAQPGISATFQTWGHALTSWSGKKLPASDATPYLERFGYWTDHGAAYYYNDDATMGYPGTLIAVRDYFKQLGVPLAYMQLDSWWYPKGSSDSWSAAGGEYVYAADKKLFATGLPAFQSSLALPLITHARWIDPASPYQTQYKMSNNVSTDPAFWGAIAAYLATSGVTVYEQDWLNQNALPLTNNLVDQDAFMDSMASAMAARGVTMQYCMPLARHFLQSTKYDNLVTTRVSGDRFDRSEWLDFLHGSRLASALGEWPWVDTFMSGEEDNLILATLSGGMVGVGDAIGEASTVSIKRSIRPDGVIVKPDAPIVPLDSTFVNEAKGIETPIVSATYSDFPGAGALRASYVWAFNAGTSLTTTFTPAELGYGGAVFVFDWFAGTGKLVSAAAPYSDTLISHADADGGTDSPWSYYVVVPLGPSGIALVGDAGKYVSLGKKRVTGLSDTGTVEVSLAFASGEGPVTLRGYAPKRPVVTASTGSVGAVSWDAKTQMFTFGVTQAGGAASLAISLK